MIRENKAVARSRSFCEAEETLPVELRPIFAQLHDEYRFAALEAHGHAFVSARVIAKLIHMGWRSSAHPLEKSPGPKGESTPPLRQGP